MPITVEKLFQSYGSYLRAKVQEKEFTGWGINFRQEIAAHQALEAEYLVQLAAERKAGDAKMKADLDEFDAKQPPRRLR